MKQWITSAVLAAAALTLGAPSASAQAPVHRAAALAQAPALELGTAVASYDWRYRSNCRPRYYTPPRRYCPPSYRSYSYSYPRYQQPYNYGRSYGRGYSRGYGGGYCY